MINRILIRIKVVQMLYAYLLTRSEFRIENGPAKNSRDERYAYSLYINLLLIILELSGYRVRTGSNRNPMDSIGASNMLSDTQLAKALSADLDIRDIIAKGGTGIENFDSTLLRLYGLITSSSVYTDYRKKRKRELTDDVQLWTVVLNTIIANEPTLLEAARANEDFTSAGFKKGIKMAVDTLTNFNDTRATLASAKKSLGESLEKAYELYHALLLLPVYLTDAERERIESAKEKYCPTPEELNPNTRFIDNAYVEAIRNNAEMAEYTKSRPITWENDYYLLKELLDKIKASDIYQSYMAAETTDFATDCELWRSLLRSVIFTNDALAEALEAKSVYWNDDLVIMGTFVMKTIKQMANSKGETEIGLLPMFKDDDDAAFGPELFINAIKNREEYRSYIDRFINGSQWDPERLAFMDIVILITAITELLNFPTIPIPVTLNEYIEIANYYSTPRSGQFINGLLYSVVNYLKEEGKLLK